MTTIPSNAPAAPRAGVFSSPEARARFVTAFKALAAKRELTVLHMALHALALGRPLGCAFSPLTNETKLSNGQSRWGGALAALHGLRYAGALSKTFEPHLSADEFSALAEVARRVQADDLERQFLAR